MRSDVMNQLVSLCPACVGLVRTWLHNVRAVVCMVQACHLAAVLR